MQIEDVPTHPFLGEDTLFVRGGEHEEAAVVGVVVLLLPVVRPVNQMRHPVVDEGDRREADRHQDADQLKG
jgi:hypothetical protein